jgi:hypothetical protein
MSRASSRQNPLNVTDEPLYAAESLYHSLGYAMNTYIQKLKPAKDNPSWKWAKETEQFNVYEIINKMKKFRDILDMRYLNIAKKRFTLYTIEPITTIKSLSSCTMNDLESLLKLVECISTASRDALTELNESILDYRKRENTDYSTLPKNDFELYELSTAFFQDLILNSSNLYQMILIQILKITSK